MLKQCDLCAISWLNGSFSILYLVNYSCATFITGLLLLESFQNHFDVIPVMHLWTFNPILSFFKAIVR